MLRAPNADRASDAAVASRARTPLALVHALAAARRAGRPDAEIAFLAGRLADAVESAGPLLVALLRWTHRFALRDADWRAAPPAHALAAVWFHADRVLDAVMGARLAPEPLRESLERSNPELSGSDLLRLQPAGPPDVAWPAWITPAAIVHHGLAAAFGAEDPRPVLGDALMERLGALQLSRTAGLVGPEARLLLRRDTWPNAMASFLSSSPEGWGERLDRATIRSRLVRGALDAIEADPEDRGAWLQLGGFGSGGLDPDEAERLTRIVEADVARLVRLVGAGADQVLWRTVLQPIAWHDAPRASALAIRLAEACRRLDEARGAGEPHPVAPDDAAEELVELASIVAACSGEGRDRAFADLLDGFARAWPALRPILHLTAGNLAARTPSREAAELWRLQCLLGAK